jgi:hypothetical protein
MRFIFRVLALFALAAAVVMAVVDATRTIAANAWTFTPIGESWSASFPGSFAAVRQFVEERTLPVLWDPVMTTLLALPGWFVFALLAFVFHALGRRRYHPGE